MKKLIKNEICGSVNSARMHCSRKTSQKLRLLFMYCTWTVAACGEKMREKEKKWENAEAKCRHQSIHYLSVHLFSNGSAFAFFGWSHGTVSRQVKAQKCMNSIFSFKKYFVTVFSIINFQFSANKQCSKRSLFKFFLCPCISMNALRLGV